MKIVILTHLENENSRSHDAVVDQVGAALRRRGHKVSVLGVHDDVKKLITGLMRRKPDLVFNLMEMFGRNVYGDVAVAGLLDLLGMRYTGGGPGEIYLQQDKGLTKKLLDFEGVKYPEFAVFSRDDDLETGGRLRMPLFVKPLRTDASIGIDGNALVHDPIEMMKRVLEIHDKVRDSALVEEYVAGREFYVGVQGNQQNAVTFPPLEMDFSGLPAGTPHVVGTRAKWDTKSVEYQGTKAIVPDLSSDLRARLQKIALDAYRALRVRDYGRIDLRLTDTNEVYVIEVNANCYLERSSEFATAAAASGLDFATLIDGIAQSAVDRCRTRRRHVALQTSGT